MRSSRGSDAGCHAAGSLRTLWRISQADHATFEGFRSYQFQRKLARDASEQRFALPQYNRIDIDAILVNQVELHKRLCQYRGAVYRAAPRHTSPWLLSLWDALLQAPAPVSPAPAGIMTLPADSRLARHRARPIH